MCTSRTLSLKHAGSRPGHPYADMVLKFLAAAVGRPALRMLEHHSLLFQFLNISSDTAGGPKGSSQSSSARGGRENGSAVAYRALHLDP